MTRKPSKIYFSCILRVSTDVFYDLDDAHRHTFPLWCILCHFLSFSRTSMSWKRHRCRIRTSMFCKSLHRCRFLVHRCCFLAHRCCFIVHRCCFFRTLMLIGIEHRCCKKAYSNIDVLKNHIDVLFTTSMFWKTTSMSFYRTSMLRTTTSMFILQKHRCSEPQHRCAFSRHRCLKFCITEFLKI